MPQAQPIRGLVRRPIGASALAAFAVTFMLNITSAGAQAVFTNNGGPGSPGDSGSQGGTGGTGGTIIETNNANFNVPGPAFAGTANGGNGGPGGGATVPDFCSDTGCDGGHGGPGGTVNLTNTGNLTTSNDGAIIAIANGGNGGHGGDSDINNAGEGGNGGTGGTVISQSSTGTITTTGPNSVGILVLSAGGRGGNGGDSGVTGEGGEGGLGGAGGSATVNNSSAITTSGNASAGIVARSVGGRGGDGGEGGDIVGPGGGGGATGTGGTVSVTNSGVIITNNENSFGIFAQSTGGAAGAAGSGTIFGIVSFAGDTQSGGSGGNVTVNTTGGSITTHGMGSSAIHAQSVGGGGGAGGTGIGLVGFGGAGGAGGAGQTVTVTNHAALVTTNHGSGGIVAQSVGGGGGSGGTGAGVVAIGGGGGGGGSGGNVKVENFNSIDVSGNGANFDFGNYGIFAQSIGGSGGSANASGGLVAIGGTAGGGGNAGTVEVINQSNITSHCTNCQDAGAIYAQSVGGGGGRGGNTGGLFAIGGSGGGGGTSSSVTVTNSGALETHGMFSRGIFAQSIGGGGGDGGFAGGVFTGGGGGGEGGSAANPLRIGGKGTDVRNNQFGQGVTVNNSGNVTTTGDASQGIFAQSVGGGGGNGGGSVSVGAFIAIAVGGTGGIGGDGGIVTVNNVSQSGTPGPIIQTSGERSVGVFAQSVGGGGGSGGFSVAASGGIFGGLTAAFGGDGAEGGDGGVVEVDSNGEIKTLKSFSSGIYAESIGGGGGRGGFAIAAGATVTGVQATLSFGGGGGAGGTANNVTVDNSSKITTGCADPGCVSDESHGIFASSIGGGGGSGGFSVGAGLGTYGAATLSFGGNAGPGNSSGVVEVDNDGEITTYGRQSHGILAQSIGGGGGSGGFSGSLAFSLTAGGAAALAFGGDGGEGGAGNTVAVDNRANITTFGNGSNGIFAQSIGGGGGNGGFAGAISFTVQGVGSFASSVGGTAGPGSLGKAVTVTHAGAIKTHGNNSTGIFAQSVGGGGGNGGFSLAGSGNLNGDAQAQSVGGKGGEGGRSGIVKVGTSADFIAGSIETSGALSHGIQAQSIAGGGGNGGFSVTLGLTLSGDADAGSVGGAGGSAQHASQFIEIDGEQVEIASVEVHSNASILTGANCALDGAGCTASGSHGIFAQSVGGGGGSGGFSIAGSFSLQGDADASSVGGTGAGGGDGGMVLVESGGEITTRGPNSHGIFAQSVGGGGGSGAFSIAGAVTLEGDAKTQSVGGSGGAAGHGSAVTVTVLNNITTVGVLSHGVLAQSVGGGGGDGGFSIAGGFALGGDAGASSVGGGGSGGGDGKKVTVNVGSADTPLLFPTIHTTQNGSIGVFAQSVGGGGGSGGFSGGLSLALDGEAENTVGGGDGGAGGIGGEVQVSNRGTITTEGDNAAGVLAQSVGGGGGNGGFSISGTLGDTSAVSNSVGGSAGGGGISSKVQVDNFGLIETSGNFSHGIIAQSIGGGGGNGGFSIAADVSLSGSQGSSSSKVGGGAGGAGGDGGEVVVNNIGTINVTGDNAFGVFAQSVGGGGGSGGIAGGLSIGGSVESAVGGEGGQGGNGGNVTVTSTGNITTTGNNSSAVFAQSVAGGGGWSGLAIGLGTGSDSDGLKLGLGSRSLDECIPVIGENCLPPDGQQGIVTVTINGQTTTTGGSLSYGLLAQAIAGGGGAMGTVLEGLLSFSGSDVVVEVGSNGSMSGDAAFQTTTNAPNTTTTGLGSIGLIAQSIGGGGGVNNLAMQNLSLNPDGSDEFIVHVGGFSGAPDLDGGGSGGGIDFTTQGSVTTTNQNAIGIIAQTIGGGGGIGNLSITSVGNSGNALEITVSGSQLTPGDAGPTSEVTALQKITTSGALSHGMVAQSIGGGGGVSNVVFQNGVVLTTGVAITLGSGTGGAGGDGGDLIATAAEIATTGAGAMGIVAQSIGGGGGLTGVFSNGLILGQSGFTAATITGGGAADGSGGVATVIANGAVHTTGFGAHGIVAQSIGGGGGIAGGGMFTTTIGNPGAFAGSVGGEGSGDDVNVTTFRNVVVAGQNSVGIFGQSAGGDGQANVGITIDKSGNGVGLIWASAGTGAAVQFADGASNALMTNGTLYAQGSLAGSGLPPNLGGLAVLGGAGDETTNNLAYVFPAAPLPPSMFGFGADYGVVFDLTTGVLDPVTGLPSFDAGTRTNNVIGNVDVAGGNNNFINQAGALFITDTSVKLDDDDTPVVLGSGQELTNSGLLSPGDRGKVQVTDVGGNFIETLSGKYFIDIDLNQQNTGNQVTDRLNVTGGSGVGGEGGLLLLSINKAFTEYVIVSSEAGTADNGFTPKLTPPAIGFDFKVKIENSGKDLVLFADKPPFNDLLQDPASGTTDPNVWRMGEGLDNIENAITVDDPFNYLINLLRLQPDAKALGDAVVTLTPSQAPHLFEATFRRNMGFLDQMVECPKDFGQGWFADRRNCLWAQGSYGEYDRESVKDSPTNEDSWDAFSIGGHAAVDEHWQVGFGLERSEIDSNQDRDGSALSTLNGEIYQFGASAYYRNGGLGIGLVAAGSYGTWDANRFVNVNGFAQNFTSFDGIMVNAAGVEQPAFSDKEIVFDGVSGIARSDPEVTSFNPRLRLSYLETLGDVDVMPFLDIDGYILHTKGRKEDGVGLANLEYPANTETTVTFTPGLELGGTGRLSENMAVRAFVRGSVMLAIDDSWTAETQFIAAPEGLPAIDIIDNFDDVLGKVDAGIMAFGASGHQLRVTYSGMFGETTEQHEVSGDFTYRF